MAWWGKLIGGAFGFMLGGPLGALLGGVLGHGLDRGMGLLGDSEELDLGARERVQTAFFTATFSIMGYLAKADGRVSEREIALAESVIARMELSPDMRRAAIGLFIEGKAEGFPRDDVLAQFRRECHRRRSLMRMFIEIQIQAAYADGRPGPKEERLLLHICDYLGIPEYEFRHLEQLVRLQQTFAAGSRKTTWGDNGHTPRRPATEGSTTAQAYAVLGVTPKATDAEVKRAYRRLLSQHHPDKLVSKGLPEEMMKLAAEKTHEIRQAYEAITRARAF
ncbi:co-chaperone DjlA [Candidatus Thiosymbion oneisti]|uniref:co-chaperone DjlA n=1 Tax=Candidatus Thiosymbion oneisti TaxID=589554 RepID=UPI000B109397|nr:co-chaperone DjlA [Candidatus Thiosymbion oneisti]